MNRLKHANVVEIRKKSLSSLVGSIISGENRLRQRGIDEIAKKFDRSRESLLIRGKSR